MFKMGINKKNGLKPCFFKIKTLFRKIEKNTQMFKSLTQIPISLTQSKIRLLCQSFQIIHILKKASKININLILGYFQIFCVRVLFFCVRELKKKIFNRMKCENFVKKFKNFQINQFSTSNSYFFNKKNSILQFQIVFFKNYLIY